MDNPTRNGHPKAKQRTRGLPAFLYRRLARWVTCEVRLLGEHRLALNSKFQVNSLQDVFCHPFYWQLYGWLESAPKLVVDLGAHCAHFSMLADICFRAQFSEPEPEYVLVEPNPKLVKVIEANLSRSGLCPRHSIHQGLVGSRRQGPDTLWVCPKNFLSASVQRGAGTYAVPSPYLDLDELTRRRRIDLLKVDIEGAEYDFAVNYPELLARVGSLMIEIHEPTDGNLERLYAALGQAGLRLRSEPLRHHSALLAQFQRARNPDHAECKG